MSSESQKEEKGYETEQILEEIIAENVPSLAKDINLQIEVRKSQTGQTQRNRCQHTSQLTSKNKRQRKILESGMRKLISDFWGGGEEIRIIVSFLQKPWEPEKSGKTSVKRSRTVNPEFNI